MEAVHDHSAPAAIIMAEADGILALGAIVAKEVYGRSLPVAVLNRDDYDTVLDHISTKNDLAIEIADSVLTLISKENE